MKTKEVTRKLVRAEKIAWSIFLGIGLNYLIITLLLNQASN